MFRLKLQKVLSYYGAVKATRKNPVVEVETEAEANKLVATGYFELLAAEQPPKSDDKGEDDKPDYEALEKLTKAELAKYAEENGVDISSCKTKADILEAISISNGGSPTMIDLQKQ